MPQAELLASFNFRNNITDSDLRAQNYRLFPRSLGQILQYAGTRELHLRFALGRWDAENWGARPWDGTREGGTGVELWAWLDAETDEEADQKWLILTNALSGLFCASLNFIDSTRTTRPVMSFQPEGDHPNSSIESTHLFHGTLPHEVVCTENLTPFLKLLPCKGKTGISSLLNGHKLFDATWQSMAIDVRPVCPDEGECVLEIEQTIDMVLDIDRSKRPHDNPIPRPPPTHELRCDTSKSYHTADTCYPADYMVGMEWSLSHIFGKSLKGTCPLMDIETPPVCIQVPHSREVFTSRGAREVKDNSGKSRCFYLDPDTDFDLILQSPVKESDDSKDIDPNMWLVTGETPLLYAERSLMGHGQERGAVQAILRNPSQNAGVEFVYMETLPWFMRIYLHTLEARYYVNGGEDTSFPRVSQTSDPIAADSGNTPYKAIVQDIFYRPAVDRSRGSQLELRIIIPAASTVFLTYDFEKTILRYTEYPPDANRGFDVAASIITILAPDKGLGEGKRGSIPAAMRTTSLLLNLPTPDFSMPYNVIIFTSTAIALAFGGMFNILVRRFVGADEGPEVSFKRLKNRIVALINKVKKDRGGPARRKDEKFEEEKKGGK